jgi:tRNA (Thr-GGU) A37 N-methylase
MNITINPIGVIKKSGKIMNILIYSDFDHITRSVIGDIQKGIDLLIVHKNQKEDNPHQVCVSRATLTEHAGNLLTVKGIGSADGDSVIDVRRIDELSY